MKFSWLKKNIQVLLLCLATTASFAQNKMPVVVSFSVLADVVKQIGGDKIDITTLVGNDKDVHEYELKPSDAAKIAQSKILFVNGLGLEAGFMNSIINTYHGTVVVASNGIRPLVANIDNHQQLDPHIWHDVNNVRQYYVPNIVAGLTKAMPEYKDYFTARAWQYNKQLIALDKWLKAQLANVPVAQRQAITTHDAFNYLAERYQIKFLFAQGVATDSEAKPQDVARLEQIIRNSKVKVVFLENMTNNHLIQQIARDTQATIGGKLYADGLSNDNSQASSYIGMMQLNIKTLLTAWGR